MREINLKINGKFFKEKIKDNILLVDFLRENLNLTGTHVGCDTSQCGACAIHVDGKLVKACTMLALEAYNCDVSTIEGQANDDGSLNFIQHTF